MPSFANATHRCCAWRMPLPPSSCPTTFSTAGAGLVRDTGSHTIAGASIPGTISYRSLRMRYRDDVMTTPRSSTAGGAVTHSRGQPWNTISSRTWRRKRPASRDQSASTFGAGRGAARVAMYWISWWVVTARGCSSACRAAATCSATGGPAYAAAATIGTLRTASARRIGRQHSQGSVHRPADTGCTFYAAGRKGVREAGTCVR